MKLKEFMRLKGWTTRDVALAIGKERTSVSKYRSGEAIPPLVVIHRIEKLTEGAVSYRDFLPADADERE